MSEAVANRHIQRVTLNLIRLSGSCPAELRPALERLNAAGWEMASLPAEDVETIYAWTDDRVASAALGEYAADTQQVIDHKYAGDHIACKLCGHNPIRFEFLLRNHSGGHDVWTGSSCIIEYGINVLGAETATAALKILKAAIAAKKVEYSAWEWAQAHPDAADRMAGIEAACLENLSPFVDVTVWRRLPAGWIDAVREIQKEAEATIRYYGKHGYLLPPRTEAVYGENNIIDRAASLQAAHGVALGAAQEA